MIGLPRASTPPSRFVRSASFSKTAVPSKTGQSCIFGAVVHSNYPMLTGSRAPQSLRYQHKSYSHQTIHVSKLKLLDRNAQAITLIITSGQRL